LISSSPSSTSSLVSAMPSMPHGAHRLAHQHRVEPAAAALAARDGAEFMPALAEELADLVRSSSVGNGPLADAGRVGLGDAEHIADFADGPRPEPVAAWAGHRVRRGDEGIGAVIDVEQRALRALEQDALARLAGIVEDAATPVGIGQHLAARVSSCLLSNVTRRSTSSIAEPAAQRVVMAAGASILAVERVAVEQVAQADGAAADLVLIGGADAAPGGADLRARCSRGFFAQAIELAVQRQDQRGVLGDFRADSRADIETPFSRSRAISFSECQGSTTTPLPMTPSLPGRTTPEGSSDSL
jgi:hypothetical protein